MFSDNNKYMKRIDEIEQKMHRLNERIPSVFMQLMDAGDRQEWENKIKRCLDFFEKNSQYTEENQENMKKDQDYSSDLSDIVVLYLAAKPEKSLNPVLERLKTIMSFRKDILSSALLAASFYGMEEINMRLPRLEEILRNPFVSDDRVERISGTIMIADGGPAEGAKAIQLYMLFEDKGINVQDAEVIRMLGLLGVLCSRPAELVEDIMELWDSIEGMPEYLSFSESGKLLYACSLWIANVISSSEKMEHLNLTARNLLSGMSQEVAAIVMACLVIKH